MDQGDTSAASRAAAARELEGKYEIVELLGRGAGGDTFEAIDLRDRCRVVLKRLALATTRDWKVVDLFQREARVLAGLQHPLIRPFRESFIIETEQGPVSYLTYELAPGRSLLQWVVAGWRPDEAEIVRIASSLLDVLSYLHALSPPVIHRDIKPANIIRSDDGRLWLVDFGAVRDVVTTLSGGSTVVGTYGYMAPEQFRGHAVPSSDLYGVASTLLFLLSGRPPTDFPQEKLKVVFRDQIVASSALCSWIDRGMEPAPEDRFASAAEALSALRSGHSSPASTRAPISTAQGPAAKTPKAARRAVLLASFGALVIAATVLFVFDVPARIHKKRVAPGAAPSAASSHMALATRAKDHLPRRPSGQYQPIRFLQTFDGGHMSLLFDLTISPDDKMIASGSDASVKIWDLSTGVVNRSLGGHEGKVGGVAFTPDGAQLVSAGGRSIRFWEARSGKQLALAELQDVSRAKTTPDGKKLVATSFDGSVRVYEFETKRLLHTVSHGAPVYSLAIAPDGRTAATGGRDGTIKLWKIDGGDLVATLSSHTSTVGALAFAPDGSLLASGGDDLHAQVFVVTSSGAVTPRYGVEHKSEVWGVAFSPDGRFLVSTGQDQSLVITDAPDGQPIARINMGAPGSAPNFSHDGRSLFVGAGAWLQRFSVARRGLGTRVAEPRGDAPLEPPPAKNRNHRLYLEASRLLMLWPAEPLEAAEAKIKEAMALDARSPFAFIARAQLGLKQAYLRGDEYDPQKLVSARKDLDQAATLGPKGVEWWSTAAWLARAERNYPAAREAVREAYRLGPDDPLTALAEGSLDVKDKRFDSVIASMNRLISSTRRSELLAWAYELLADSFAALGDVDAAEASYRLKIDASPRNPWTHGNYAHFLLRDAGDATKAIDEARRAIAISDYGAARNVLANAYIEHGDDTLWRHGRVEEALRDYEQAIAANPNASHAYFGRAAVYRTQAMTNRDPTLLSKARADLEKTLVLEPQCPHAPEALAELGVIVISKQ